MSKSFGAMSVAQLSVLIQGGAADPVDVAETVFESIANYADKAVFTTLLEGRAMEEAHASSKRLRVGRSLGLLDGITIARKVILDI
jgi:aspartyl-tRNA(Asn)/glutamyl-tRNA(Gln) amidotransferase subunit A